MHSYANDETAYVHKSFDSCHTTYTKELNKNRYSSHNDRRTYVNINTTLTDTTNSNYHFAARCRQLGVRYPSNNLRDGPGIEMDITSLNVRGIQSKESISEFMYLTHEWMQRKKVQIKEIVLIQEHNLKPEQLYELSVVCEDLHYVHITACNTERTSALGGAMIIIDEDNVDNINKIYTCPEGRLAVAEVIKDGEKLHIASIYAPANGKERP